MFSKEKQELFILNRNSIIKATEITFKRYFEVGSKSQL
jgi:hypothetical protein